jgi:predicted RNA-binding Zn-ribbon protein involved in translation (DUF1610 family)
MANDSSLSRPRLMHFHLCTHCGSTFRREQYEGRALTSGIFPCQKCGLEGPLNITIQEVDEDDSSA